MMYNLPDMPSVIDQINAKQKKKAVVDVRSGDTVRVHQKIREGIAALADVCRKEFAVPTRIGNVEMKSRA